VQEVRWDKEQGIIFFFNGRWNENHQLGTEFFVHHRKISAIKRVESVSDRMSYIVLKGHWYDHHCSKCSCTKWGETWWFKRQSLWGIRAGFFDHFPKYHTKIPLGDFNAKVGRENIFKPTIENESLHQDSNDNGGRNGNSDTSKNLVVKSMMFPCQNLSWLITHWYIGHGNWVYWIYKV